MSLCRLWQKQRRIEAARERLTGRPLGQKTPAVRRRARKPDLHCGALQRAFLPAPHRWNLAVPDLASISQRLDASD
jgi:hypothetical protein